MRRAVELGLALTMVAGLVWIAWGIGAHRGAMAAGDRFERGAPAEPRLTHIFDHDFEPSALAVSPDGHLLAVGGRLHRAVMVWDLRNSHLVRRLEDGKGGVTALVWSRDGRHLIAGRSFTSGAVTLPSLTAWDVATWATAYQTSGPFEPVFGRNDVVELAVSPDGESLAVSYHQGGVGLHDLSSGRLVRLLTAQARVGGGIAFSPDGAQLAASAGRAEETVNLFDVKSGAWVDAFPAGSDTGRRLTWQSTGRAEIASIGFRDGRVAVWNPSTRQISRIVEDRAVGLSTLSYSPDGGWLATVAPGLGVVIRDAGSDRVTGVISDEPPVLTATWSPDSRRLATAQGEQARIWDLADLTRAR